MRAVRALIGVLIVAVGTMAAITGEFSTAAGWILAAGLASVGLAGIISAVATSASADDSR